MRNKYRFRTSDLCRELGITRMTLVTWENKGYISCPRVGTRGDRRFTREQLDQITKAFSPGGRHEWHFKANS